MQPWTRFCRNCDNLQLYRVQVKICFILRLETAASETIKIARTHCHCIKHFEMISAKNNLLVITTDNEDDKEAIGMWYFFLLFMMFLD